MKYFVCFLLLLFLIGAFLFWMRQKRRIQSIFIKKILFKKYNLEKTDTFFALFADEIFEMVTEAVLSAPSRLKHSLFKNLKRGNEKALFQYLKKNEAPVKMLLDALLENKNHTPKKPPQTASKISKLAALLDIESQFEYQLPAALFEMPHFFFLNRRLNNLSKLLKARRLFLETDLKKSSEILMKLAKIYQGENDAFKTAYVYFMLGQIYSLSKAFDAAQIIFQKALQIFKKTHCSYGTHLVLTALALNFMCHEHFENAHDYFNKAHRFFHKTKNILLEAKILNGKSFCHLSENSFKKANQTAGIAFKLHQKIGNRYGMAFSLELKAAADSTACRHKQALNQAKAALKHYRLLQNPKAEQKMLLMIAKIYHNAAETRNAKNALAAYFKHKNKHHLPSFEDEKNLKEIIGC